MNKEKLRMMEDFDTMKNKEYRRLEQVKASCDHRKPNGKPNLKMVDDDNGQVVQCRYCQARINLAKIDHDTLSKAVATVIRAIETIKVIDDEISESILEQFGNSRIVIEKLPKYYNQLTDSYFNDNSRDEDDYSGFNALRNRPEFVSNPNFFGGSRGGNRNDRYDRDDRNDDYRKKKKHYNNNDRY